MALALHVDVDLFQSRRPLQNGQAMLRDEAQVQATSYQEDKTTEGRKRIKKILGAEVF